jgi:hypothetical protein
MNHSMVHIFVKVNLSDHFMAANFNFRRRGRSGPSWLSISWRPWSGPYTGTSRTSERTRRAHHISNMITAITELYLIDFMSFLWLRKAFISRCGQVLGRMQDLSQIQNFLWGCSRSRNEQFRISYTGCHPHLSLFSMLPCLNLFHKISAYRNDSVFWTLVQSCVDPH